MAVDLEAIARRGRCDASNLKIALPLLEQGYSAPFLARYRQDELGGIDELTLWNLKAALDAEQSLAQFRDELYESWQATPLADPSIGDAIKKSGSKRTLQRLSKRLRQESGASVENDATLLAVRLLNPQKGDAGDVESLAGSLEAISDQAAAKEGLKDSILKRLLGDPRVISAAVRWLGKNAKIHISDVHDPHIAAAQAEQEKQAKDTAVTSADPAATEAATPSDTDSATPTGPSDSAANDVTPNHEAAEASGAPTDAAAVTPPEAETPETENAPAEPTESAADDAATKQAAAPEQTAATDEAASATAADAVETPAVPVGTNEPAETTASEQDAGSEEATDSPSGGDETSAEKLPGFSPDPEGGKPEKKPRPADPPKKTKKISARQKRRRWLVGVLKPLEGKRLTGAKLSAFQLVMLGRALRSQVATCAFEYDAAKLVAEIKRVVVNLNRNFEVLLSEIVMEHEADIREAGEGAWWDEMHERASARLVGVAAEHLRDRVNRGPIEANVVMSIDANGPRTAATAIVSADGRVLKGEDLPCQLTGNARAETVAKMGELIHQYNVDLVVVSNGPARKACLIALGDLIAQSPDGSIRWTIGDRHGAEAYAQSDVANTEMRSTSKRFRAAAWLAFSVMHPAQAYAKVNPLKLRLASFQSELADEALAISLGHVLSSGASRGGVDANSAPLNWLQQLPGMSSEVAQSLVKKRETELLKSRNELLALEGWKSTVESRQALPFLRIFNSDESLDGTLVHPDDYQLAKKLAKALEIELPPAAPPGYVAPDYQVVEKAADEAVEPTLVDATQPEAPAPIEDFDHAGEKAGDFQLPPDGESVESPTETDTTPDETAGGDAPSDVEASSEAASIETASSETPDDAGTDPATSETQNLDAAADAPAADPTPVAEGSGDSDSTAASPESGSDASNDGASSSDQPNVDVTPVKHPRPEQAKIDKCIKEWQIGKNRANQVVDWLCEPFGESFQSDEPPGLLTTMPTLTSLKPGDKVVGVVVSIKSFGIFVELAPDCSGLVHVSRISDGYVEDLNETVQVGDVITAWVTGIDEKRRRVALSALSPETESRLKEERSQAPRGGGYGRGGRSGGGGQRQGQGGGRSRGAGGRGDSGGQRQGQGRQGQGGQGQGQGRGGKPAGASDGRSSGRGQQSGRGGGRGRDSRGGGRGRDGRGGRKPRQPESYRVVSKPEAKPISDAMQKGDEPLRSFGDLMQFYSGKESDAKDEAKKSDAKKSDAKKSQGDGENVVAQDAADGPVTTNETKSSETAPPVVKTDPVAAPSEPATPTDVTDEVTSSATDASKNESTGAGE